MNSINFDNPWLLFLLIPLFALVIVPFVVTVRKDNRNWHNIVSCVLHLVMCASLVFALSGMTFESVITETQVYVVADVSYSANENLDLVDEYIGQVEKCLPKNSSMGVVCFGRKATTLTSLGERRRSVKTIVEATNEDGSPVIDRSATDIAAALRYAGNMFDEGVIKRIVLITDGAETVSTNSTIKVVNALKNDGVLIDAVYLNDNIAEDTNEIQIDGVEATKSTYLNKEEKVNVLVRSNNAKSTQSRVTLLCNGETVISGRAEWLDKGLNILTYSLDTSAAGVFNYTVRVSTESASADTTEENNVCYFTQTVNADISVLFIGGSQFDLLAGRRIYGTEGVTFVTNPSDIPLTVEALCAYDEIALCNFDLSAWTASLTFLDSLKIAVQEFGKTLTTYGNTYIQNTFSQEEPDEALTLLSDMLPVNVGNSDMSDRIIVLLIDISMSQGFSGKLNAAQEAAIGLLNVFGQNDTVMIVGFSGDRITYCQPTKLRNRTLIIEAIRNITVRNGTLLNSAMQSAYNAIVESGFHNRELIIISDGIIKDVSERNSCNELAAKMSGVGGNVIISAIGIQPGTEENAFLKGLVENPNANGKGYYQRIENEDQIEYVVQSVSEATSEVKMDKDVYSVNVNLKDEEVVNGIAELESVNGFWVSNLKPSATVVASAVYYPQDVITPIEAPLYAYWSHGKGKVVSILTDVASDWTRQWTSGSSGDKLLQNIKMATLPSESVATPLIIETAIDGVTANLSVTTANVYTDAVLVVTVVSPDGTQTTKRLNFATENYQAQFDAEQIGTYSIFVSYDFAENPAFNEAEEESDANRRYLFHYEDSATFSISYFPEYDAFSSYSLGNLYKFVTSDTISEDGTVNLDISELEHTTFTYDFTIPLMIFSVILIVADIIIRKLRWKDILTFFKRSGSHKEEETKGGRGI